jgi:hypothetical protein
MADNYADTADRMILDARSLRQAGAHRNACYLAGYVVECTLKALLEKASGRKPMQIHDLQSLQDEMNLLIVRGNAMAARYPDPTKLAPQMLKQVLPPRLKRDGSTQHFCHWDPYHRYDGSRWNSDTVSKNYLHEADSAFNVIIQMLLDGNLP